MLDQVFDQISKALLYEGYLLYEHGRRSPGDFQWQHSGMLTPHSYGLAENWQMRTECLVEGTEQTVIDVRFRCFCLKANDGIEQRMNVPRLVLGPLTIKARRLEFVLFPDQKIVAKIEVAASKLAEKLFKISAQIQNLSLLETARHGNVDEILRQSMFSMHTFLHLEKGEFVSLLSPPEEFRKSVLQCESLGTQAVLYGKNGGRKTILSSPFVRRDYPEVVVEKSDEPALRLHPD